jgi:outer membrane protein, multidrug efflux system
MRNRFRNRFGTRSIWILLLSASMLPGCSVGPNYHRPSVQAPPAFHGLDPSQQTQPQAASFADLPWWEVFHDPQLQKLIRTALKQNYDVQLAVERVTASRAQLGIARSNEFPQVSLNPNFSGGKDDENLKSNIFSLAGDVVFQVDLFGRYRRATEAARAQLLGTKDAQQTVTLTLVSDVASDYFLLRNLDLQLQITQNTVRTQEDSLKLTSVAPPARRSQDARRAAGPASARFGECVDPGSRATDRTDRGRDQHLAGKVPGQCSSRPGSGHRDSGWLDME